MDKFDEINSSMKETPETSIFHLTDSFIKTITSGETLDPNRTVAEFSQKLMQQVKSSCEPLQIINSEINSIKLIASDELLEKLEELKDLNTDLYNEMMHSLSLIGGTQLQDFQSLKSVGQQERWKRFTSLHNEIMSLMRKEIGI